MKTKIDIRLFITCLLLFISTAKSYSQNEKEKPIRYWSTGLSTLKAELRDDHMSPMKYEGILLTPEFNFLKIKQKSISKLDIIGSLGTVKSANATSERPMQGNYYRIDIGYSYLRFFQNVFNDKYKLFFGGNYKFHGNVRLNEQLDTSFITFIFMNSLGASVALERELSLFGKTLILRGQLDLPITTHVMRPNFLNVYNYLDPEHDWFKERWRDSDVLLPNKMFRVVSSIDVMYPIKGNNYLGFSYTWDYYSLTNKLPARAASHQYQFSYMFFF